MRLVRFGVSMEEELLAEFDRLLNRKGYANRSEALRDLVRRCLVGEEKDDPNSEAVGVISYVYDHEKRELARQLTEIGHSRLSEVISSMHVHLDVRHCLETVVARGKVKHLNELADTIFAIRGVLHGEIMISPKRG